MSLQRQRLSSSNERQQQTQSSQKDHGNVDAWGQPYDRPIAAEVDGQAVRILQPANVIGMSPTFLCTDDSGKVHFIPVEDATITDPNYLPTPQFAGTLGQSSRS